MRANGLQTSNPRSDDHFVVVPWHLPTRAIAIRLFLTCWILFVLHFATNIPREVYLALTISDDFSFRVDQYAHMHPDLFPTDGYGWHIANNPGASMIAAIPYTLLRPITDPIVNHVKKTRAAKGQIAPPSYESPWPAAQKYYREAWQRGLDAKLGIASFIMQSLCMAPLSALSAVVMFYLLRLSFRSDKTAFWLSLLYALGTPVFFRTGYLNQNLMLGVIAFLGFVVIWNPGGAQRWSTSYRFFLGGLAGGTALLLDYSGVIFLTGLFLYGILKRTQIASIQDAAKHGGWYIFGALGPIILLWLYQWQSFGHPFYPPQHYMPRLNQFVEIGYQGYGWPQWELLIALLFDYRYGLFVCSPLLLLALLWPLKNRRSKYSLPKLELAFMLAFFIALWVFFSGSNFTRLQFNTGIRYLTAILPFLFIPAALMFMTLPRNLILLLAIISVTESWCLAMYRDVERGNGMLDPILHVLLGGFQLPVLTTLSRMKAYADFFPHGPSPLPLFALTSAILWVIWHTNKARSSAL